jgi:hypothetical protein
MRKNRSEFKGSEVLGSALTQAVEVSPLLGSGRYDPKIES